MVEMNFIYFVLFTGFLHLVSLKMIVEVDLERVLLVETDEDEVAEDLVAHKVGVLLPGLPWSKRRNELLLLLGKAF